MAWSVQDIVHCVSEWLLTRVAATTTFAISICIQQKIVVSNKYHRLEDTGFDECHEIRQSDTPTPYWLPQDSVGTPRKQPGDIVQLVNSSRSGPDRLVLMRRGPGQQVLYHGRAAISRGLRHPSESAIIEPSLSLHRPATSRHNVTFSEPLSSWIQITTTRLNFYSKFPVIVQSKFLSSISSKCVMRDAPFHFHR